MKDGNNTAGLGIGLLAGLLVGLAIGLLYAPQPGEETREGMANYLDKILFRLKWLLWSPEKQYLYLWHRTRDL